MQPTHSHAASALAGGAVVSVVCLLVGMQGTLDKERIPCLTAEQEEILSHMSIVYLDDGFGNLVNKTIRFEGVNVQVVNGLGTTQAVNGVGNFIAGYNELGNNPYGDVRTGSHNIVGGVSSTYESFGGLVVAEGNSITAPHATVTGGIGNRSVGGWSTVTGGRFNLAVGPKSAVLGGLQNTASGGGATVVGGRSNQASGEAAALLGGCNGMVADECGEDHASLGDWTTFDGTHQAATDGIVIYQLRGGLSGSGPLEAQILSDALPDPATIRARHKTEKFEWGTVISPVRKGEYFKAVEGLGHVTGNTEVRYFIPFE